MRDAFDFKFGKDDMAIDPEVLDAIKRLRTSVATEPAAAWAQAAYDTGFIDRLLQVMLIVAGEELYFKAFSIFLLAEAAVAVAFEYNRDPESIGELFNKLLEKLYKKRVSLDETLEKAKEYYRQAKNEAGAKDAYLSVN